MKEKDIRPKKIFEQFLHLTSLDIKKYFNKPKSNINCVACGKKGKFSFKKKNFSYCECLSCKTLFVNPRPRESAFFNYYMKRTGYNIVTQLFIFCERDTILFCRRYINTIIQ